MTFSIPINYTWVAAHTSIHEEVLFHGLCAGSGVWAASRTLEWNWDSAELTKGLDRTGKASRQY